MVSGCTICRRILSQYRFQPLIHFLIGFCGRCGHLIQLIWCYCSFLKDIPLVVRRYLSAYFAHVAYLSNLSFFNESTPSRIQILHNISSHLDNQTACACQQYPHPEHRVGLLLFFSLSFKVLYELSSRDPIQNPRFIIKLFNCTGSRQLAGNAILLRSTQWGDIRRQSSE
ncbi:Hypothetical_protein [Hexamita inflata]|uniref:Hypothetical_protein n=1 Tax=Hexamita inflata TaxID=28002 RepID=A0ABP1KFL0_9EUKA